MGTVRRVEGATRPVQEVRGAEAPGRLVVVGVLSASDEGWTFEVGEDPEQGRVGGPRDLGREEGVVEGGGGGGCRVHRGSSCRPPAGRLSVPPVPAGLYSDLRRPATRPRPPSGPNTPVSSRSLPPRPLPSPKGLLA